MGNVFSSSKWKLSGVQTVFYERVSQLSVERKEKASSLCICTSGFHVAQVMIILLSVSCLVHSQILFLFVSSILAPHFSVAMLCWSGTSKKLEKRF